MVDKLRYKLIGLLVAVGLYFLLLGTIYYAIFADHTKKKDYGFNVEEAIVVDIDTLVKEKPKPIEKPKPKTTQPRIAQRAVPFQPPQPKPEKIVEKKVEQKEVQEKPPKKEQPQVQEKKESRDKVRKTAKDLFSTVRTDKYQKAMEEKRKQAEARASRLKKQKAQQARKRAEAQERKRKAEAKRRAREAKKAQKLLEELERAQATSKHKKSGEEHEFWSFVSNKIMAKWNRTIATQDGLKGYATIRIDNKGRLSYSNLKLSGNSLFDTKLKVFLDNLEYTRFPPYKGGPYIEAVFEFKDQAKGR
jgi:membrane protein involved in colicin uptake